MESKVLYAFIKYSSFWTDSSSKDVIVGVWKRKKAENLNEGAFAPHTSKFCRKKKRKKSIRSLTRERGVVFEVAASTCVTAISGEVADDDFVCNLHNFF